jgi:hypothetical protein
MGWKRDHGVGESPLEKGAPGGQGVENRRLDVFGIVTAHPVRAQGIDRHQEDIAVGDGRLGRRSHPDRSQKGNKKDDRRRSQGSEAHEIIIKESAIKKSPCIETLADGV